jgi:phospho-N-acetylmuramoyl-pentapeptide-transferase
MTQFINIIPFAISFAIAVSLYPLYIGYMRSKQYGQTMLEELEEAHSAKQGTPTMGGIVFLLAATLSSIVTAIWANQFTISLIILLFILLLYGVLGFLDDFMKIFKAKNEGLTPRQKLVGQVLGGLIFYLAYLREGFQNYINVFGLFEMNVGYLYGAFIVIWLVGFSNAVNLTDGLDGLVSISATISFGAYAILAFVQAQYDVMIVCTATMGGLIGFFNFNHKPAKIFMGDVGSLALGGLLAAVSSLLHQEWTLLIIGIVYVIETLSVMIQVTSFKLTGKRVFRMSPIHHHFELGGFSGHGKKWSEWKVDIVFWLFGLCFTVLTVWYVLHK